MKTSDRWKFRKRIKGKFGTERIEEESKRRARFFSDIHITEYERRTSVVQSGKINTKMWNKKCEVHAWGQGSNEERDVNKKTMKKNTNKKK